VGGAGKEIDAELVDVDRDLAERLDGVGVDEYAVVARYARDRGDGLDRPGLVVDEHDRDQEGVGADRRGDRVGR